MGDKKGKKDRAKEHRQTEAKHVKAAQKEQERQHPATTENAQVRGLSNSR